MPTPERIAEIRNRIGEIRGRIQQLKGAEQQPPLTAEDATQMFMNKTIPPFNPEADRLQTEQRFARTPLEFPQQQMNPAVADVTGIPIQSALKPFEQDMHTIGESSEDFTPETTLEQKIKSLIGGGVTGASLGLMNYAQDYPDETDPTFHGVGEFGGAFVPISKAMGIAGKGINVANPILKRLLTDAAGGSLYEAGHQGIKALKGEETNLAQIPQTGLEFGALGGLLGLGGQVIKKSPLGKIPNVVDQFAENKPTLKTNFTPPDVTTGKVTGGRVIEKPIKIIPKSYSENIVTKNGIVETELPVNKLSPNEKLGSPKPNKVAITKPINVVYNIKKNRYAVTDGHHRLAQAIANKQENIPVNMTVIKSSELVRKPNGELDLTAQGLSKQEIVKRYGELNKDAVATGRSKTQEIAVAPQQVTKRVGKGDVSPPIKEAVKPKIDKPKEAWEKTKTYKVNNYKKEYYDDYALKGDRNKGVVTVEKDLKNGFRIRNIFVDTKLQREGYATQIYESLNNESIKTTGKPLRSSEIGYAKKSGVTTLSKEGQRLWQGLESKGKAKIVGNHYEYVSKGKDYPELSKGVPEAKTDWKSDNKAKYESVVQSINAGKPVYVNTAYRSIKIAKPEHIRMTKSGDFQIPEGGKWVHLTQPQVDFISQQAGFKKVAKTTSPESHYLFLDRDGKRVPVAGPYKNAKALEADKGRVNKLLAEKDGFTDFDSRLSGKTSNTAEIERYNKHIQKVLPEGYKGVPASATEPVGKTPAPTPEITKKPVIKPVTPKTEAPATKIVEKVETPKQAISEIIEGKQESKIGMKEFKERMLAELDKAEKSKSTDPTIEIHIPGDGSFKIANKGESIAEVRKKVSRLTEKWTSKERYGLEDKKTDRYKSKSENHPRKGWPKDAPTLKDGLADGTVEFTPKGKTEIPGIPKDRVGEFVKKLDDIEAAAKKRIAERGKGTTLGSGPFHELPNAADYVLIGAAKIAKGTVKFAQWSKSMIDEHGDTIKPYLREIYRDSRSYLNNQKTQFRKAVNVERFNVSKAGQERLKQGERIVAKEVESKIKGKRLGHDEVLEAAKTAEILKGTKTREQTKKMESQLLATRQHISALAEGKTAGRELIETLTTVSSYGTDIARQLESLKITAEPGLAGLKVKVIKALIKNGKTVDEILAASKNVDFTDAKQVTEFYRKVIPPNLTEIIDEYRYINMLSSPRTHIVNIFSNMLQVAGLRPATRGVAGGLDAIVSGLTKKQQEYYVSQVPEYYKGMYNSFGDASKGALDALKGKILVERPDLSQIPTGKFGWLQSIPRALEAMDVFFRTLAEGGERRALQKGQKLGGKKLSEAEIDIKSKGTAEELVFRKTPDPTNKTGQGSVLSGIDAGTTLMYQIRKAPYVGKFAKWFTPFIRTPMNIVKQGIEYSPLGFTTMIKATNKLEQASKAIVGSMVFTAAGSLALEGKTTWAVPRGKKEKELFYSAGMQPYSIKIGDKWYGYAKLGPLAYPVAMAAATQYYLSENPHAATDDNMEKMTKVMGGIAKFFSDQSYVQGIGDIIKAIGGEENAMANLITGPAQQLIPLSSLQRWIANLLDPIYRKPKRGLTPEAIVQSIQKGIPLWSKSLPAYKDTSGRPSKRDLPVANAVSPINIRREGGYTDVKSLKDYRKNRRKQLIKDKKKEDE